jgi:hypothetical protein
MSCLARIEHSPLAGCNKATPFSTSALDDDTYLLSVIRHKPLLFGKQTQKIAMARGEVQLKMNCHA